MNRDAARGRTAFPSYSLRIDSPTRRQHLIRAVALVGTAIALTWPLAIRFGSRLPIGDEPATTVPRFNLWTLEWNARGLGLLRSGYWDAPIFSPTRGAFAFSDPQPLTGGFFHVLTAVGIGATVAYAMILLGALTLNGVATSRLLDRLGLAFWPATLTGALAVGLPFVTNELGVLQLSMVWPVLFALGALLRYVAEPRLRTAIAIGAWTVVALTTSQYYALMLLVLFVAVGAVYVWKLRFRLSLLTHGLAAASVVVLFGGPIVMAESSRLDGYAWSRETIRGLGATPGDWIRLNDRAWGEPLTPWLAHADGARFALYPGTIVVGFAIAGFILACRSPRRRFAVAMLVAAAVTAIFAGGLGLETFGWSPYSFLHAMVPGFVRVRSPFRFAVLTQLCVLLLAGIGIDALWRRDRVWGPWLATALTVVALFEVAQLPARTATAIEPGNRDWIAWLDDQPLAATAMVPFPTDGSAVAYDDTTLAMLLALQHGQPLVNGYTGLFPDGYVDLRKTMADFPDPESVAALRTLDVGYIVVQNNWLTDLKATELQLYGFGPGPDFEGDRRSIYVMPSDAADG